MANATQGCKSRTEPDQTMSAESPVSLKLTCPSPSADLYPNHTSNMEQKIDIIQETMIKLTNSISNLRGETKE
jgi:hypothetical protein